MNLNSIDMKNDWQKRKTFYRLVYEIENAMVDLLFWKKDKYTIHSTSLISNYLRDILTNNCSSIANHIYFFNSTATYATIHHLLLDLGTKSKQMQKQN